MTIPRITILDGRDVPHPEDMAMIQAMYSRSPAPIEAHLEKVAKVGSGKFMDTMYVGYGHESIGDLGNISVFIEGLSMAAAKVFQDNELYRGQECSTRYIDFSKQPFYYEPKDDAYNQSAQKIMEGWRTLYQRALVSVSAYVRQKYAPAHILPVKVELSKRQAMYDKTIIAITFDICRGLLPIGATTSIAWSGELRTFSHHLKTLIASPLPEVARTARHLYDQLRIKYPNSFAEYTPSDKLIELQNEVAYYRPTALNARMDVTWAPFMLQKFLEASDNEFSKELLPFMDKELRYSCQFTMQDKIDFASYRDIQRHRHGYMSLSKPNRESDLSNDNWYAINIQQADTTLWKDVIQHYVLTQTMIESSDDHVYQYFMPMMVDVPIKAVWNLHQMIYVCNLRSGVTVHPTLRLLVKSWAKKAEIMIGRSVFTIDPRSDYQSTWRGDQSIEEKVKRDGGLLGERKQTT